MLRRVSWILGSLYLLLAALNVVRRGIFSLPWIAWALLSFGALRLVYTPIEKDGKTQYQIVLSRQNQVSAAATFLGVVLLIFLIAFRR
jgi:hypothetical protein